MCLLSLNDTEIKNSILSINYFKNSDDTIYLLEIDDYINYNDLEIMKIKNNIIYITIVMDSIEKLDYDYLFNNKSDTIINMLHDNIKI